ncbi:MAG TPA: hypothetical protein VEF03_13090 [Candidatus Binataceae bacterium]|nr:hypothetical protein [Candidatus Binataceae bacterium]
MARTIMRLIARTRGATQLGVIDVITGLVLLGILLWAASKQFPTYSKMQSQPTASAAPSSTASP